MSPAAGGRDRGCDAWSKGTDDGGVAELTKRGGTMVQRREGGAAAAVLSAGVDTRSRKERGRQSAQAHAHEAGWRGKKEGGVAAMGRPL
jgi:hypothetical protein